MGYPGMGYPGMGYPGMGYPGMGYPGMGYPMAPPMVSGPSIYSGSYMGSAYPGSVGGYAGNTAVVASVGNGYVGAVGNGYGGVGAIGGAQYVGSVYGTQQPLLNQASPFYSGGGLSMGTSPMMMGRQYGSVYGPQMGYPGYSPYGPQGGYGGYPYGGYPYGGGYGYGSAQMQPPCSCDSGCAGRDNNVCCEDVDQC